MEYEEDKKSLIIDNGTGCIKAGFSGENEPQVVIPNCEGRSRFKDFSFKGRNDFYYGDEIKPIRNKLNIYYPMEHGLVKDWSIMEDILGHILFQLSKYPEEYNIMLTEPIINPREQKEAMTRLMFEAFDVSGIYFTNPGLLSLYSIGLLEGIALDSGDGVTQFVPVYDGIELPPSDLIEFGGRDLSEYMVRLLNELEYIPIEREKEIAKKAKEEACYVSLNFKEELKSLESFEYKLPDDSSIFIKDQRIKCCEALFNPNMAGLDYDDNIAKYCNNCIIKCHETIKKILYNNIFLSGGNTMFKGFPERLTKEIKALAPESYKNDVKVIAEPERNISAWKGGSIISTLSTFDNLWITKKEYEEYGAYIVTKKTKKLRIFENIEN